MNFVNENNGEGFLYMKKLSIETFKAAKTKRDLADSLGESYKSLCYNLYKRDIQRYKAFEIKKSNGGVRSIVAPNASLKRIQRKLARLLSESFVSKRSVHGFTQDRSIKTNAKVHLRKRVLINVDLKDFFPSIHFGRVMGMFKSHPFNFNSEVAQALANLCCNEGQLPQGAPTSPVISNFICRSLDNSLIKFAKKYRFNYTRYADDLSFSSNVKPIPAEIGVLEGDKFILSSSFKHTITKNGFEVNDEKTRCSLPGNKKEVTGVLVNTKLNVSRKYIRLIRAMLHSWESDGLEGATKKHFKLSDDTALNGMTLLFSKKLVGMINYVRFVREVPGDESFEDTVYEGFRRRLSKLKSDLVMPRLITKAMEEKFPTVLCEGHTDPLHLNRALHYFRRNNKFIDLDVRIVNYPEAAKLGDSANKAECERIVKLGAKLENKIIYLFDRDNSQIKNWAQEECTGFKKQGENIYSAVIPKPIHRDFDQVCIEHYYDDEVLQRYDSSGRRLFLSTEFDPNTGELNSNPRIKYVNTSRIKGCSYPAIIDSKVYTENARNMAMSKKTFANHIHNLRPPFESVDFDNFLPIFELLEKIVND